MKTNRDSTYPCLSPTPTVNSCDLSPPTQTQTSEQESSDLTASNGRSHAGGRTHATLHKAFHKEPGRMLSRGRQSMWRRLQHSPKIYQNFAAEWNVACSATARTKTALGITQLWFNYFAASFSMVLGNVNVNYLKIPKTHCGPHERLSRATCGTRASCL